MYDMHEHNTPLVEFLLGRAHANHIREILVLFNFLSSLISKSQSSQVGQVLRLRAYHPPPNLKFISSSALRLLSQPTEAKQHKNTFRNRTSSSLNVI